MPPRSCASRQRPVGRLPGRARHRLFVPVYWFYELGGPAGLGHRRLESEREAASGLRVERGYNIYEANCARCHGDERARAASGRPQPTRYKLVPAPQRGIPRQRADRRRALRLRQPRQPDAGLADGPRAAQLPPDRRADRVHPPARRVPRARRGASGAAADPRPRATVETFTGWRDPNCAARAGRHAVRPPAGPTNSQRDHRRRRGRVQPPAIGRSPRRRARRPASVPPASASAALGSARIPAVRVRRRRPGRPGQHRSRLSRPASSSRRPTSWRRPTRTSRSTSTTRMPTFPTTSTSATPTTPSSRTVSHSPVQKCAKSRSVRYRRARTPSSARSIRT